MFIIQINLDYRFAVLLLDIIVIFWVYCNYWILHFCVIGWYHMSMSDIWCSWTDLEAQHCDGEEFQPKHPGVLSEKVIGCCLGLHTPCQCMWGSVEMAGIRCALTYQAAQHCRNQQAEVLVHAGNTIAARARLHRRSCCCCCGGGGVGMRRRRRRWGGRSRWLRRGERVRRSVGEESQPCWRRIPIWNTETVAKENSDWKCPTVHTNRGNILVNKMCFQSSFHIHMTQALYSQSAAFVDFCHCKIENKSTKPTNNFSLVNNSFKHHV